MTARIASRRLLAAVALSLSALAFGPARPACAQWREAYQSDWLGTAPHNEGYAENVWIDVDYALMRITGQHLPALVTSAPIGTPLAVAATLGDPDTTVTSGEEEVGKEWRSGIQVRGGVWLDPWQQLAITGDYFNVGEDRYRFTDALSSGRIIARPFYDFEANEPGRDFANVPGQLFGSARVRVDDEFEGAGASLQHCLFQAVDCCDSDRTVRLDVLAGYRFYRYWSGLDAEHTFVATPGENMFPDISPGDSGLVEDHFDAFNEFHGGELALDLRLKQGRWWIEGLARVALGANRRSIDVDGLTSTAAGGVLQSVLSGGMLTSEVTNFGRRADTDTAVIPELRVGIGCQLMPRVSVRMGYEVVVWDNVLQAASHLPPNLVSDPRNLPPIVAGGSEHPEFPGLQESTLVAHGFDIGLEFAY
jgi:hypothetical protein